MPVKQNREYRSMDLLTIPAQNKRIDSEFYVEGYATTFDNPYLLYEYDGAKYFEIIKRDALMGTDMSDVIMQYDHNGRVRARTSNQTLGLEADNHGLFTFSDLSKSSAAKELYEDIFAGLVTKMSWAFTVDGDVYDSLTRTRTITKIKKIYDVSAVSMPANDGTEISARSWLDGVIEEEKRESLVLEIVRTRLFFLGGSKK